MLGNLVSMLIWGVIAGFVARAILPGEDKMNLWQTALLGIAGSFIGGTLGVIFSSGGFDTFQTSGLIGSVIGAVIALIALRMYRKNNA